MMRLIFCSLMLALYASTALAQNPYQPMGAPVNGKVAAQWNRYHDYTESTKLLQDLAAAWPDYARLESAGTSYGGREMWVLTVTDFAAADPQSKPGFWIDGGIHANEIQATEVVLYTAWYLLEGRADSSFIQELLQRKTFYLMPMMSPDGRDAHLHEPSDSSSPRTGLRPIDNDRDGLIDEDAADDLDGDGHITNMRIPDPNGRWKEHPDFPGYLVPAEKDEPGQYTRLGDEGFDNDGDGQINEDDAGGYDPNRDWPWNWQPWHIQWGAWKYPLSVEENRMVARWIMAHPNIAAAQSYHNSGGMILHGPGQPTDPYPAADDELYNFIGKRGEEMLPGYKNMRLWDELYPVWGGEVDWLYKMHGALAFTNELFTSFNYFRQQPDPAAGWQGSRDDQRKFDKYLLFGEGYVPWHTVDHPQYGKVEVGGAKKNWGRQPPSFLLEEECHRNMAFTLYHADQLPRLSVQKVETRPLEGGLTEVTAVIANAGAMPTHLAVDLQNRITPPDWVGITAAGMDVIAGYQSSEPFFLNAQEQQRHPKKIEVANIRGNGAVYVRWIVRGGAPYVVIVESVKGGQARAASAP
jgi:murein tripeptide amidase MpaA